MAIDYMIDLPCKAKDALSLDGLVSLIKQRNRALAIIGTMRKDGKSEEQALSATFKVQVATPRGVQVQEQKVSDLLNNTKKLDELQEHCKGCLGSGGRAFGCYRSISYPISGRAEEWLADISKKAADSKGPGMLPLQFIIEKRLDGGSFKAMRADPRGAFFERKVPVDVVMASDIFKTKRVNTDQVLNLMMGMSRMNNTHMKLLLFFSGGLGVRDSQPQMGPGRLALKMTGENGQVKWWTYDMKDDDMDDRSIRDLKEYFRALFTAYGLEKDLLISL